MKARKKTQRQEKENGSLAPLHHHNTHRMTCSILRELNERKKNRRDYSRGAGRPVSLSLLLAGERFFGRADDYPKGDLHGKRFRAFRTLDFSYSSGLKKKERGEVSLFFLRINLTKFSTPLWLVCPRINYPRIKNGLADYNLLKIINYRELLELPEI